MAQMTSKTITMTADNTAPRKTMCGGVDGWRVSLCTPLPLEPTDEPGFEPTSSNSVVQFFDRLSRNFVDAGDDFLSSSTDWRLPRGPTRVRSMKIWTWPPFLPLQGRDTLHIVATFGTWPGKSTFELLVDCRTRKICLGLAMCSYNNSSIYLHFVSNNATLG